jgi:phage gpG-like protein
MITGRVVGSEAVQYRLSATVPNGVKRSLERAISSLAIGLQREVKTNKLSGGVLKVKTGTLRRSIDQVVKVTDTSVTGEVSTNVRYGKVHEYGFSGAVNIGAHTRKISQAFGRPIAPQVINVGPYVRHVQLPERSFLRSALRDLEASGKIDRTIKAAVAEGIRQ